MGAKVGAVSMTQHDHRATACRNVPTPHRLRITSMDASCCVTANKPESLLSGFEVVENRVFSTCYQKWH
jgi:hypothetical protein